MNFELATDEIDVPKNTGIDGFLHAIKTVLKRRKRIQKVEIDARGKIVVSYYARPEDPRTTIEVDFDGVAPGALIRNAEVSEVPTGSIEVSLYAISRMLQRASVDQMYPIGFVTGANTVLFEWVHRDSSLQFPDGVMLGFPVFRDRHIPDDVLLLATSFGPGGVLADVQKSYKITMPPRVQPTNDPEMQPITPGEDAVEVLPQ